MIASASNYQHLLLSYCCLQGSNCSTEQTFGGYQRLLLFFHANKSHYSHLHNMHSIALGVLPTFSRLLFREKVMLFDFS